MKVFIVLEESTTFITTPLTSITTASYTCPDKSDPLKAGPTPSGQQSPFVVYSDSMEDIKNPLTDDLGTGSEDGLVGNNPLEIEESMTVVLKPRKLLVNSIMSIILTIQNVKDIFDVSIIDKDGSVIRSIEVRGL